MKPEDVIWYLCGEVEALKPADLTVEIGLGGITIKTNKWLEDGWSEIMDIVEACNGQWISAGGLSHWVIPDPRFMEERVNDERWIVDNRPAMMWWLQQPESVRIRLIPASGDKDAWGKLTRDEKIQLVKDLPEWRIQSPA